jgi:hypothetical protein
VNCLHSNVNVSQLTALSSYNRVKNVFFPSCCHQRIEEESDSKSHRWCWRAPRARLYPETTITWDYFTSVAPFLPHYKKCWLHKTINWPEKTNRI